MNYIFILVYIIYMCVLMVKQRCSVRDFCVGVQSCVFREGILVGYFCEEIMAEGSGNGFFHSYLTTYEKNNDCKALR